MRAHIGPRVTIAEAWYDPGPRMEEEPNLTRLEYEGREIFIVGTAHISQRSVEQVNRVIETIRPDTVCVELDETRYKAMVDEDQWKKLDVFRIVREQKVLFLLSSLALSSFQRRMGAKLGVKPGAELLAAVNKAKEVGAELVLADRDIQATLKRTWSNLSLWNKSKTIAALFGSFLSTEEISEEQIEKLKDRDNISEAMKAFAREMPDVQVPLIDERDRYLMSSVQEAPGKRIVAVVGAGHVEGMVTYLGKSIDRAELSKIPTPSLAARVWPWVIPLLVVGAMFYTGLDKPTGDNLMEMILAWVLPTATLSAIGSVIALANPVTVLVAFLAAPLTTLHPAIGVGMFTGLVEAWLRKPTVEDCEQIQEDMNTLRGMYKNRVGRVLLVALLSSIGAALGAYVGATWVLSLV